MNKGDLITQVAEKAGISKTQASDVVNTVFSEIEKALKPDGGKAAFIGFGTFTSKHRTASVRPNPLKKGETMTIAAKNVIKFKAAKGLEEIS